jgi:PHS family inorganic phosphate transporter-like MFS transporter
LFYGNVLFQRVVLDAAFGAAETISKTALHDCILHTLALPGYFISIVLMRKLGPRFIQSQGFFVMMILYLIIGVWWSSIKETTFLLLGLYGGTFFFANFGPNSTTFILPSLTFSPPCRNTLNGVSAAAGKLGALLGAILFEPASQAYGSDHVMLACAAISIVGLLLTQICVPANLGDQLGKGEVCEVSEVGEAGNIGDIIGGNSVEMVSKFVIGDDEGEDEDGDADAD